VAIIIPANSAADTGYSIDNSCRFNRADSAKFERAIDADGSLTTWTFNVWLKRGEMTASNHYSLLWNRDSSGTAAITSLEFYGTGTASNQQTIYFYNYDNPGDGEKRLQTTAKYRDPSAWYNLHVMWDSSNATAGNRMRIFINGTEETDFILDQNPGSSAEGGLLRGSVATKLSIGFHPYNNSNYYDGYMANAILCDGQAYLPTKFGEFNEDSPTIWQPIDPSEQSLSFGTHGFWLDFADSSDLGNDVSGQNNDFTPANFAATDQCVDSPTNNFCTLNPLDGNITNSGGLLEGNTTYNKSSTGSDHNTTTLGTLGAANGKWYFETKIGDTNEVIIGFADANHGAYDSNNNLWNTAATESYGYRDNGTRNVTTTITTSHFNTYTTNDIVSIAIDLDNGKIYAAKNGTWETSGDPTSGATGTGSFADISDTTKTFVPIIGNLNYVNASLHYLNFGNPSYANSSDAADANGDGKFEYAPPSGYYALCTKNVAEYG